MLGQILVALGLTVVTVIIHGLGTLALGTRVIGPWRESDAPCWFLRAELMVVRLVCGLLLLHLAEISIWSACYWVGGMLPDFETAMYFSFTSYTTLGFGDVLLPKDWRLLGASEAAIGVLMLGWSTALIVAGLGRVFGPRFRSTAESQRPSQS